MFKLIPESLNFYINTEGVVKDNQGNIKNTYYNNDGYITVAIKLLNNNWQTFGVHRLIALTHIENTNENNISVNHIDGNIENNIKDNLEWCTVQENNIHAAIMNGTTTNPSILIKNENNTILLANFNEACVFFQKSIKEIWEAIKTKSNLNGWFIYHYHCYDKIPLNYQKVKPLITREGRELNILDLETGDVLYFKSLYSAAEYFKVKPNHIHICINTNDKLSVFLKRYIIVYEGQPMPSYTVDQINKILKHRGCSVLAFNVNDGAIYIFENAKKFVESNNLSRKTVYTNLAIDNIKLTENWLYIYLTNENEKKFLSCIKCPDFIQEIKQNPKC